MTTPRAWRSIDILRAAALVMGLYLALQLLWLVHPLVLTAFLGVLFGLAVARGADHLTRLKIPRAVGAAFIVFGFYTLLYGLGAWAAPILGEQFAELRVKLPQATDKLEGWVAAHRDGVLGQLLIRPPEAPPAPQAPPPGAARPGPSGRSTAKAHGAAGAAPAAPPPAAAPSTLRDTLARQVGTVGRYLFPFLSSTLEVIAGLGLITFVTIYIAVDPKLYYRGLLTLFPHPVRPRAAQVLAAIAATLRQWLLTQFIAMLTIGVITSIALRLLGIKAALSLGIIAGLLEFIPTLGPLLSAVPAVAMGFLDSPQKALLVALVFWGIQLVENHLLIPLLMKKGMDLPPVLTILGQALLAVVFGFLGLLVAVPLIASVMVAVKMLYVEDVVGNGTPAAKTG